jgi:hypothetical protein
MKRIASLITVALLLIFAAPGVRFCVLAQEEPRRKTPRLSMDNFEGGKMILPPVSSSRDLETKSPDADPGGYVSVNPRNLLTNTLAQLEKVKSLRMRMKATNLQDEEREAVMEMVRPNRLRMRSTGMEMIAIGSTVYFKTANEPWKTATTNQSVASNALNPKDLITMALNSPGVSMSAWAVGEEVVAGTPTTVYEITMEERGKSNQLGASSIRMWIGKQDELPRKMEFSAPGSALKMSVSYGDFNTKIVINAPRM